MEASVLVKYLQQQAQFAEVTGYDEFANKISTVPKTVSVRKVEQTRKIRNTHGDDVISSCTYWTKQPIAPLKEQTLDGKPILSAETLRNKSGAIIGYVAYT